MFCIPWMPLLEALQHKRGPPHTGHLSPHPTSLHLPAPQHTDYRGQQNPGSRRLLFPKIPDIRQWWNPSPIILGIFRICSVTLLASSGYVQLHYKRMTDCSEPADHLPGLEPSNNTSETMHPSSSNLQQIGHLVSMSIPRLQIFLRRGKLLCKPPQNVFYFRWAI